MRCVSNHSEYFRRLYLVRPYLRLILVHGRLCESVFAVCFCLLSCMAIGRFQHRLLPHIQKNEATTTHPLPALLQCYGDSEYPTIEEGDNNDPCHRLQILLQNSLMANFIHQVRKTAGLPSAIACVDQTILVLNSELFSTPPLLMKHSCAFIVTSRYAYDCVAFLDSHVTLSPVATTNEEKLHYG